MCRLLTWISVFVDQFAPDENSDPVRTRWIMAVRARPSASECSTLVTPGVEDLPEAAAQRNVQDLLCRGIDPTVEARAVSATERQLRSAVTRSLADVADLPRPAGPERCAGRQPLAGSSTQGVTKVEHSDADGRAGLP